MAQYYQVLSQGDKTSIEEIRAYYPNIVENPTVQYVISPDEQQFQGQQILLTSDQLMVIENQGQQVLVDQSQITYQNSQYIIQDGTVEYQDGRGTQQQIYYMEEVEGDRQSEQQIQPSSQPVVLNHQIQTQVRNSMDINAQKTAITLQQPVVHQINQPVRQTTPQSVRQVLQQVRPPVLQNNQAHVRQPLHQTVGSPVQLVRPPNQIARQSPTVQPRLSTPVQGRLSAPQSPQVQPGSAISQVAKTQQSPQTPVRQVIQQGPQAQQRTPVQSPRQPSQAQRPNSQTESDNHEAVALADGTIITLAEYKKLLAESKQNANNVSAESERSEPTTPQSLKQLQSPQSLQSPQLSQPSNPPTPKRRSYNRNSNRGRNTGRAGRNTARGTSSNVSQVHYTVENNCDASQQQERFMTQQQMKMLNQQTRNIHQQPNQPQCVSQNQFMQQQTEPIMHPQAVNHQAQPVRQQQQLVQQQYVQPQYIIQPPSQHQQQCPLPPYVPSSQIQQIIENTPISEEYSDSIRMLVLLENGEQRLITFTLPREMCTIQEILEQVGVPFHPDTKIECIETNTNGINYVVTVGTQESSTSETIDSEESSSQPPSSVEQLDSSQIAESSTQSVEPPKEVPRFVTGRLAVCMHCGYLSEDFNKCLRCRRKLPEDVKSIASSNSGTNGKKSDLIKAVQEKKTPSPKPNQAKSANPKKKPKPKVVEPEPVILTLSSDEEEDTSNQKFSPNDPLIKKLAKSSVTLSTIRKEPSASDIQQDVPNKLFSCEAKVCVTGGGKEDTSSTSEVSTTLECRTVRIGSYRYIPAEDLVISSSGVTLKVPMPKDPKEIKTIVIERKHMVKVLANFQKMLPVIFYYVMPSAGQAIREQLDMAEGGELYFDPLSKEEAHKRITILPEYITEDSKAIIKKIYTMPSVIMDELTAKEANDILIKTCPKELTKIVVGFGYTEIKQLLIYPPGKGGLPINTEDYLCLAQDQFLNDVIIDFYLKYLVLNLPVKQQEKVHVFSTFFYKRLTTKPLKASRRTHPAELDPTLTASAKRHARVEKWTKSVNLFEKDYIIIPINESCHWFLAIVCFPALDGCYTMDGRQVKLEPKNKRKKPTTTTIGSVTITAIKKEKEKEEKIIACDDGEASDKDEAEGDESELDSEEDNEETEQAAPTEVAHDQPIKQPCILIFDSLAGASRSRVVATLRDYLTCEYKAKMGVEKIFNKDVIKGACPRVPQQTNFTDCGLYLLQYVEQFFKDPIKDYRIPIKQLKDWFDEFIVTKKREDISLLIKQLMVKYNKDASTLPDVTFPTLNGKLVLHNPEDEEDEFEEEEDEMMDEPEPGEILNENFPDGQSEDDNTHMHQINVTFINNEVGTSNSQGDEKSCGTPRGDKSLSENSMKPTVSNQIPPLTISDKQKISNRDALSYLKAKRIHRHKSNDSNDVKKFKTSK